ncbi:MAG: 30S ribosomal protein S21 [Gemmatimonadales bacterium]
MEVILGENDRLEFVLKKFRRQIAKSGLFQDMKRKRFYEAPGAQRRRKEKAAVRRKAKSAHRREHQHQ